MSNVRSCKSPALSSSLGEMDLGNDGYAKSRQSDEAMAERRTQSYCAYGVADVAAGTQPIHTRVLT